MLNLVETLRISLGKQSGFVLRAGWQREVQCLSSERPACGCALGAWHQCGRNELEACSFWDHGVDMEKDVVKTDQAPLLKTMMCLLLWFWLMLKVSQWKAALGLQPAELFKGALRQTLLQFLIFKGFIFYYFALTFPPHFNNHNFFVWILPLILWQGLILESIYWATTACQTLSWVFYRYGF